MFDFDKNQVDALGRILNSRIYRTLSAKFPFYRNSFVKSVRQKSFGRIHNVYLLFDKTDLQLVCQDYTGAEVQLRINFGNRGIKTSGFGGKRDGDYWVSDYAQLLKLKRRLETWNLTEDPEHKKEIESVIEVAEPFYKLMEAQKMEPGKDRNIVLGEAVKALKDFYVSGWPKNKRIQ